METSMCRVCSSTRASQYISAFQDIVRIERKYCTFIFLVHDCLQIQVIIIIIELFGFPFSIFNGQSFLLDQAK